MLIGWATGICTGLTLGVGNIVEVFTGVGKVVELGLCWGIMPSFILLHLIQII